MTAGLSVSVRLTWRRMSYLNIGKNSCQKLLPFQAVWNYVKGCNDRVKQFRLNPEKIQKSYCKEILCNYFHLVKKPFFVLGNNKLVSLFLTGCTEMLPHHSALYHWAPLRHQVLSSKSLALQYCPHHRAPCSPHSLVPEASISVFWITTFLIPLKSGSSPTFSVFILLWVILTVNAAVRLHISVFITYPT